MTVKLVAMSIATLLVFVRAGCEYSMMNEYGTDAQMGIWFIVMVVKMAFWLLTGLVVARLLAGAWENRWRPVAVVALGVALVWVAAIGWASVGYVSAGRALSDASSASTSPERLSELAEFDGIHSGYELDNRIASNPNTPPDILRLLHGRPEQVGTEICLARNPNTPEDILLELANRNDDWAQYISDSLKRNPKYDKVFGNRD